MAVVDIDNSVVQVFNYISILIINVIKYFIKWSISPICGVGMTKISIIKAREINLLKRVK